MRNLLLAGVAGIALTTTAAHAQQPAGFYIGLGGGVNFADDADFSIDDPANSNPGGTVEFDTGWAVIGSVGYAWGNGLRTEFELGYRDNDIDDVSSSDLVLDNPSGDQSALTAMVNALYDIDTGTPFTPYIGVGIGAARIDWSVSDDLGNVLDDDDWQFAYQGILGASYAVTQNLSVTLDYRYLASTDPEFSGFFDVSGLDGEGEFANHTILAGLRYTFGAAPAPMAEAVTVQGRQYLVFFEFDSSMLTDNARAIVTQAAADALQGKSTRLDVTGHADRSGTDSYNQALSLRRANTVAGELVNQGVAADAIVITAFGESQPLVPTPDGVREPQNRRVEIVVN